MFNVRLITILFRTVACKFETGDVRALSFDWRFFRSFFLLFLFTNVFPLYHIRGRLRLKCDGTRAETRFHLSAKRTSPFKSAGGGGSSVQSTTGSRGVRISGSNAGYTVLRSSVKGTGYPLHSPVSLFTSPPVRHRVPSRFSWTLPTQGTATEKGRNCVWERERERDKGIRRRK